MRFIGSSTEGIGKWTTFHLVAGSPDDTQKLLGRLLMERRDQTKDGCLHIVKKHLMPESNMDILLLMKSAQKIAKLKRYTRVGWVTLNVPAEVMDQLDKALADVVIDSQNSKYLGTGHFTEQNHVEPTPSSISSSTAGTSEIGSERYTGDEYITARRLACLRRRKIKRI
jgi:hypothetical protein